MHPHGTSRYFRRVFYPGITTGNVNPLDLRWHPHSLYVSTGIHNVHVVFFMCTLVVTMPLLCSCTHVLLNERVSQHTYVPAKQTRRFPAPSVAGIMWRPSIIVSTDSSEKCFAVTVKKEWAPCVRHSLVSKPCTNGWWGCPFIDSGRLVCCVWVSTCLSSLELSVRRRGKRKQWDGTMR